MTEGDHEDVVVRTRVADEVGTLWLRGDLDVVARDRLANAIRALVSAGATALTVDFSDVRFIDSSGVGALLEGQRLGATLVIRNPAPNVRRVLEIVGVDTFASIENT
jgi:anti-sigma B factor antagonist